ncbi:MAG: hypothetical protein ABIQ41_07340 [Gemmatimonadales bacterium]
MHQPKKLADYPVADLLSIGTFRSLDRFPGAPATQFYIRLWTILREGGCVDGTHVICNGEYYLAFRRDGEDFESFAYDLGSYGELTILRFVSRGADTVAIEAQVASYPRDATPLAPGLVRRTRKIVYVIARTSLSEDSLSVTIPR